MERVNRKNLISVMNTVRYANGRSITDWIIQSSLKKKIQQYGIRADIDTCEITSGIFGGEEKSGIALIHPDHINDYYKFCIVRNMVGSTCTVDVYTYGQSRNIKHEEYAENVKVFNGSGTRGAALGLFTGGAFGAGVAAGSIVGGVLGAGARAIGKGINALMRDSAGLEAEQAWYNAIFDILYEILDGQDFDLPSQPTVTVQEDKKEKNEIYQHRAYENESIPYIKRAFLSIEDEEFEEAADFCERALNIDPENPVTYVAKLLAELKITSVDDLKSISDLLNNKTYKKIKRFTTSYLEHDTARAVIRIVEPDVYEAYSMGVSILNRAKNIQDYRMAAEYLSKYPDFLDSAALLESCSIVANCEPIYNEAKKKINLAEFYDDSSKVAVYKEVIELLEQIGDYMDSLQIIEKCKSFIKNAK